MTTDSLDSFLKAKRPSSRLIGDIERHLMTRPAGTRDTLSIHPSSMCKDDWCHRAQYFQMIGTPMVEDRPNLRLQSIFDEGHSIHHKWQKWFREMGVLTGEWSCSLCHDSYWATSPTECLSCGGPGKFVKYREVGLRDYTANILGHADGWITGIGDECLIELKSIGAGTIRMEDPVLWNNADGDLQQAWRGIRRPFRSHLMQGNIYLETLKRMYEGGLLPSYPKEIVFIYELKADQAYKEFTVKASYDLVKDKFEAAELIASLVYAKLYTQKVVTPPKCNLDPNGCKACKNIVED